MATRSLADTSDSLAGRYRSVRRLSLDLAALLSDADACLQPMPDASPAKWHLAHTTWFFETFLLRDRVRRYRVHDESFAYLFNSYYEGEGERHPRARRGMISRPSLDEVRAWRFSVDAALLDAIDALPAALVELGLNHEQQHQELMLMDLKAAFAENPLRPPLWDAAPRAPAALAAPSRWLEGAEGVAEIGHDGTGFAFDCEGPRHKVFLHPHALADRAVTNEEWLGFIADGGYADPLLWLSDGWAWVRENGIEAPLYWLRGEDGWSRFGLDGLHPVDLAEPVCHISYYEADAFARWAGARLPTEAEWECAAGGVDPGAGNQLDAAGPVRPLPAEGQGPFDAACGVAQDMLRQMFGDVWEWTGSAFLPYPGFAPAPGAVGEYNGKFMCGQMVLRGGCCATPRGHLRASYRNFFYPHQRWMFSGLRLARDA
jgi:ergothioneine biosynthesis protein EgtB